MWSLQVFPLWVFSGYSHFLPQSKLRLVRWLTDKVRLIGGYELSLAVSVLEWTESMDILGWTLNPLSSLMDGWRGTEVQKCDDKCLLFVGSHLTAGVTGAAGRRSLLQQHLCCHREVVQCQNVMVNPTNSPDRIFKHLFPSTCYFGEKTHLPWFPLKLA